MNLKQNINNIQQLITQAELEYQREPESVLLLAVSKTQPAATIRAAYQQGLVHFGENYYQEALNKINALDDLPLCWHFIGPIQSNKTLGIAKHFDWVHSINRLIIAQLLNEYRPKNKPALNICLQINLIEEKTKAGISPEEATRLAQAINQLPNLKLRGLMTIPPPQKSPQQRYDLLLQLNHLMQAINEQCGLQMDTLSMGMSDDLKPAIQAGSTIVRIGRAIFGEREGNMN